MKALIFNSGLGSRMGDFTATHHKAMARLGNGETIFARQLRILAEQGITDFVVTSGPFADQLAEQASAAQLAGCRVTFVPNADYDSTNYIYSLHLARALLDDDVLMLHGDLVFNRRVIARLLADPRPDLGAVNAELPLPAKDFKARLRGGRVDEVSVSIFDDGCQAFQPLYKLSRRAMAVWLGRVGEFVEAGNTAVYAENALNEVAEQADIRAFSYEGDSLNEVDTLADLDAVRAEIRRFDFAEQPVLAEQNDYRRIPELLAAMHASRPLLVGGSAWSSSFVRDYLADQGVRPVVFDGYSANPTRDEVTAGLRALRDNGCDSLISFGGGSAIDVAKCIKLLAVGDGEHFPLPGDAVEGGFPHLAIPTTAGTGSESTHFAVVYVDGEKHSVAHDAMLPDRALLEPRLLISLPEYHKKATVLDALCQCIESSWASSADESSLENALAGLRLILANMFGYFHKGAFDEEAARRIMRAANNSGKAINVTKTTAPHAMSYSLTSRYELAHGHAAALCLSRVWRHFCALADAGSPQAAPVLAALDRLAEEFGSASRLDAVEKFDVILEFLQMPGPPSVADAELDELVASVNQERLENSPVPLSGDDLRALYRSVFALSPVPAATEPGDRAAQATAFPSAERYADLRALHGYELEILRVFDTFCADHGLQYYLSEGSILGAIRHGGLIPWDDDIDVMMPREDYRRLTRLSLAGELPEGYAFDSYETNERHWVFGGKVQLTRATEFHLPRVAHVALNAGPYIDIFPVDGVVATSGPKFRLQAFILRVLRRMLFMSSGRSRGLRTNSLARIPIYLVTRVVSRSTVHNWVVWAQSGFNSAPDAAHWANLCTYYPIEREVFPKNWFGTGRRVPFEQMMIPVPNEAERMLEKIYGPGYGSIPSLQVRRTRSHAFAKVDDAPTP